MNCFQARRDFPDFWRQRLDPATTDELAGHLGVCGLCDQAYRLFALTAPVLHSDADAVEAMLAGERAPRRRRAHRESGSAADHAIERHGALWAALSMLVAASVVAYMSVAVPDDTLAAALSRIHPTSAVSAVQEPPSPFLDDFAG